MSTPQHSNWLEPLKPREIEILILIEEGLSNREIAEALHLSHQTIIWYNKQTYSKLGVKSRTKAVAKAREYGLLPARGASTKQKGSFPPHNLPSPPTPFVGRVQELAELHTLILEPTVRLMTIIGPGGIGKTRLAQAVAEGSLAQSSKQEPLENFAFTDGIFFIPLTGIEKPDQVHSELASVLNYQFEKGGTQLRTPKQQILDYLKHKQMLLIMDNFEQLVDSAGLLVDILGGAPEIKILATSRERLNLIEEHLYLIRGLPYPVKTESNHHPISTHEEASAYPAVRLFLQSASRLRPGLSLTDDDLSAIIQICQQVEGMPLALELAASWVNVLSISDIASEIEYSYDFMHTSSRNIQERHRNMRAVFDSTWGRLTLEEQEVFAQLSLFHGSFTRQAAQRVTRPTATLGLLASLTNKSLIIFDRKKGRFHIHELLRQYGKDKIALRPDKVAAFKERFGDYFTLISQRLGEELKGHRQIKAMGEIEADIQNIRAAWEWALFSGRVALISRTIVALGLFFQRRGRFEEGESLFESAAARLLENEADISPPVGEEDGRLKCRALAEILIWQSNFEFILGHLSSSCQLLEKSITLLDQLTSVGSEVQKEKAFTKYLQGVVATFQGEREMARQLCLESLEHYRRCEDQWGSAMALEQLCVIGWYLGDQTSARQWGEECLRLRQELGDQRGIADSYIALADVIADELNLEEAVDYAEQALQLYEKLDDHDKIVNGIYEAGAKWMRSGDFPKGYSMQVQSYRMARELNLHQIIPKLTCQIAYITNHLGNYEETHQWTNLSMPLARDMKDQRSMAVSFYSLGLAALAKRRYLEAYQMLVKSAAMIRSMKDRRLLAMVLAALGRSALGAGIDHEVKPNLFEALQYCVDVHSSQAPLETFVQIAFILNQEGDGWAREQAIELYSLATRYPYVSNSQWLMDTAGTEIERSISELTPEVVNAKQARGRVLDIWNTVVALREELSKHGWGG